MAIRITSNNYGGRVTISSTGLGGKFSYGVDPVLLLLDYYPASVIAYSVRKLRRAYTGATIRVRRSSDNAETDIGFVNNSLDTTTLLAFCGAGSGFVTTWYDQSLNVKNLIQATTANQPRIVNTGVVELVNSRPAIYFDGVNDAMSNSAISTANTALSLFEVFKINDANQFVINTINTQYNLAGQVGGTFGPDSLSVTSRYKNSILVSITTQTQVNTTYNTNLSILSTQFFPALGSNITSFGISNFGSWEVTGHYQEAILYPSDQISNRLPIETNINSYYTIY